MQRDKLLERNSQGGSIGSGTDRKQVNTLGRGVKCLGHEPRGGCMSFPCTGGAKWGSSCAVNLGLSLRWAVCCQRHTCGNPCREEGAQPGRGAGPVPAVAQHGPVSPACLLSFQRTQIRGAQTSVANGGRVITKGKELRREQVLCGCGASGADTVGVEREFCPAGVPREGRLASTGGARRLVWPSLFVPPAENPQGAGGFPQSPRPHLPGV